MPDNQEQLAALLAKLELLSKKQEIFSLEVNELRKELTVLQRNELAASTKEVYETEKITTPENAIATEKTLVQQNSEQKVIKDTISPVKTASKTSATPLKKVKKKSNLEKFIGENLINKIGILITVIGVFIGTKYSIENNLISPLTRIILGYLVGLGLVVVVWQCNGSVLLHGYY